MVEVDSAGKPLMSFNMTSLILIATNNSISYYGSSDDKALQVKSVTLKCLEIISDYDICQEYIRHRKNII